MSELARITAELEALIDQQADHGAQLVELAASLARLALQAEKAGEGSQRLAALQLASTLDRASRLCLKAAGYLQTAEDHGVGWIVLLGSRTDGGGAIYGSDDPHVKYQRVDGVPLGFSDRAQFTEFVDAMESGLADAGYPGVGVAFQGSAVTGISYGHGKRFREDSDYDLSLAGEEIHRHALAVGVPAKEGENRTKELRDDDYRAMGLHAMWADLNARAGRDVNFVIFSKMSDVLKKSGTMPVLPRRGDGKGEKP